jgi:hypothetical protein
MVMVCQEHVTKGLHLLPAPHVKEIAESANICCSFCSHKAKYKLFILSSSTQFIFLEKNQQKVEMDHKLSTLEAIG